MKHELDENVKQRDALQAKLMATLDREVKNEKTAHELFVQVKQKQMVARSG